MKVLLNALQNEEENHLNDYNMKIMENALATQGSSGNSLNLDLTRVYINFNSEHTISRIFKNNLAVNRFLEVKSVLSLYKIIHKTS
jgi:hypothetical protein